MEESLTVFIGIVALLLLAAPRHVRIARGSLVRPGGGRTDGIFFLLLQGRLLSDGAPATVAERAGADGLLGSGLRAACSRLSSLLLLAFLLVQLVEVVAVR